MGFLFLIFYLYEATYLHLTVVYKSSYNIYHITHRMNTCIFSKCLIKFIWRPAYTAGCMQGIYVLLLIVYNEYSKYLKMFCVCSIFTAKLEQSIMT